MEKSEFRVLIKHYFLRKKTITETKQRLDKYYGDSAPWIKMIINGLRIFGVVVQAQVMLNAQDAQLRSLLQR